MSHVSAHGLYQAWDTSKNWIIPSVYFEGHPNNQLCLHYRRTPPKVPFRFSVRTTSGLMRTLYRVRTSWTLEIWSMYVCEMSCWNLVFLIGASKLIFMQIWTNGLYKSTLHRVIHKGDSYRVSWVDFLWNTGSYTSCALYLSYLSKK